MPEILEPRNPYEWDESDLYIRRPMKPHMKNPFKIGDKVEGTEAHTHNILAAALRELWKRSMVITSKCTKAQATTLPFILSGCSHLKATSYSSTKGR